jgi:uncharacterized protein YjbI with pentapeptide repeats
LKAIESKKKKEGIMVKKILYGGVAIMLFQWALFTGIGFGFDNAHLQKLNSTNKCEKCDLSNANLSGLDMYGATLAGANLSGANLAEASFNDANLIDANLTGANIKGTNFAGAKLSNATWADGKKCKPGSIGKCK